MCAFLREQLIPPTSVGEPGSMPGAGAVKLTKTSLSIAPEETDGEVESLRTREVRGGRLMLCAEPARPGPEV